MNDYLNQERISAIERAIVDVKHDGDDGERNEDHCQRYQDVHRERHLVWTGFGVEANDRWTKASRRAKVGDCKRIIVSFLYPAKKVAERKKVPFCEFFSHSVVCWV